MNSTRFTLLAFSCLSLVALTGCDTVGAALGMSRTTPDEHAVTTNDPLSLPPDYALKPPRESPKSAEELRKDPTDPDLNK